MQMQTQAQVQAHPGAERVVRLLDNFELEGTPLVDCQPIKPFGLFLYVFSKVRSSPYNVHEGGCGFDQLTVLGSLLLYHKPHTQPCLCACACRLLRAQRACARGTAQRPHAKTKTATRFYELTDLSLQLQLPAAASWMRAAAHPHRAAR